MMTIVCLHHVGEQLVCELLRVIFSKEEGAEIRCFEWTKPAPEKSVKFDSVSKKVGSLFGTKLSVGFELPLVPITCSNGNEIEFSAMSKIDVGVCGKIRNNYLITPLEVKLGKNPLDQFPTNDSLKVDKHNKISGKMLHVLDRKSGDHRITEGLSKLHATLDKDYPVAQKWVMVVQKHGYEILNNRDDWPFSNCSHVITLEELVKAAGGKDVANHILRKLINSEDFILDWYLDIPK